MGHNIRDLVHPQDFMEVAHIFANHDPLVKPGMYKRMFIRRYRILVHFTESTFDC